MKVQRVYTDTSVIGGCFDPEFAPWSNGLFQDFRLGLLAPVVSVVVAAEVAPAPEEVRRQYAEHVFGAWTSVEGKAPARSMIWNVETLRGQSASLSLSSAELSVHLDTDTSQTTVRPDRTLSDLLEVERAELEIEKGEHEEAQRAAPSSSITEKRKPPAAAGGVSSYAPPRPDAGAPPRIAGHQAVIPQASGHNSSTSSRAGLIARKVVGAVIGAVMGAVVGVIAAAIFGSAVTKDSEQETRIAVQLVLFVPIGVLGGAYLGAAWVEE